MFETTCCSILGSQEGSYVSLPYQVATSPFFHLRFRTWDLNWAAPRQQSIETAPWAIKRSKVDRGQTLTVSLLSCSQLPDLDRGLYYIFTTQLIDSRRLKSSVDILFLLLMMLTGLLFTDFHLMEDFLLLQIFSRLIHEADLPVLNRIEAATVSSWIFYSENSR